MDFAISGIVPVIPTPFHRDGAVLWQELQRLVGFALTAGASAVCLPAYGSEFYKLSEAERLRTVEVAALAAGGDIPVIAQVNAGSRELAREWIAQAEAHGASAIATAVPRQFAIGEDDLFRYLNQVFGMSRLPFMLQDFNPGGATISPALIARLHAAHPRFRYVKLEEPRIAAKVDAIEQATEGGVQVLQGWGGMYLLEAGERLAGVMPGLGMTDLLGKIFRLMKGQNRADAYQLFAPVLPQIVYSLHNLELYHHVEKRLLAARGLLSSTLVRPPAIDLSDKEIEYIDFLNARVLAALEHAGFESKFS